MNRLIFAFLCLSLLISGCISEYGRTTTGATQVQLSEVIRDPSQWNDKIIQVEGIFNFDFEGDAIYLSKKDLEEKNYKKSLALSLNNPDLAIPFELPEENTGIWRKIFVPLSMRAHIGKSALVTGTFHTQLFGNLHAGTLYATQLTLK